MHSRRLAACSLLLALCTPLAAQGQVLRLIEHTGAGAGAEAFQLGLKMLDEQMEGEAVGDERATTFEFTLAWLDELAEDLARSADLAQKLQELRNRPALSKEPLLAARLEHVLAGHLLRTGKHRQAAEIYDRLGTVTEAWLLGPLDNERGGGFRSAFPAERTPESPLALEEPVQGKARDVQWRRIDIGASPTRSFDFDAMLRPNEQVLALLAVAVHVETRTEIAVRIGSGGSTVVRVNGEQILERDAQARDFGFDQDHGTCVLQPGQNLLLVKTGCQENRFRLRLRLTRPDGSPLQSGLVETSTDPEKILEASRQAPSKEKATPSAELPSRRMRERLDGALALQGDARQRAAELAFLSSFLARHHAREDESSRQDRVFAKLATELAPGFGPAWWLYGNTLESNRWSADRDDNARFRAYEQAVQLWPRALRAMLELSEMERQGRRNLHKAWLWFDRARSVGPTNPSVVLREYELLQRRGMRTEAAATLRSAMRDPRLRDDPGLLSRAITEAIKNDALTDALELAQRSMALQDSPGIRRRIARLQLRLGRDEAAEKSLRDARARYPWEYEIHESLAALHVAREEWSAAERAWSAYLEFCPEASSVWFELAKLAARRGDRPKQIAHLERALELDPSAVEKARLLEFLREDQKPFFSGFEIDGGEIIRNAPEPSPRAIQAKESHEYLLQHTLVRAYADGTTSRYVHFVARVLTERGAQRLSGYSPPFHGGSQTARILEARVVDAEGQERRARLGRAYYVSLPKMRPGDFVEVKARVDDRFASFFGDYFGLEHSFAPDDGAGCIRSRLDLLLEKGRSYSFQTVGDVRAVESRKLDDGTELRSYAAEDLVPVHNEPLAPTRRETGPLLRVSTYSDWNEFAAWWWDLIRKQTVITPEIRAKVRELTEGADSREEKLRRIYEFVSNRVRYKAWEFGVHGYKPYSIDAIYARLHGDCKDKAILMNAMLGEAGIEAFPVLIHAEERRERDDLSLPLVEHFNHCISYVPTQEGIEERYLDGTAEYHPLGVLPEMDYGADVLVVRGHEGRTQRIPWPEPSKHQLLWKLDIELTANGDAVLTFRHRATGFAGPSLRQRFDSESGKRRERLTDELGRIFGKVEIVDMEFSDLANLQSDPTYELRVRVPGLARPEQGGTRLRLEPVFRRQRLSSLTTATEREQDMLLTPPSSRSFEVRVVPPPGWKIGNVPKRASFDADFGSYALTVERKDRAVTIGSHRLFRAQRITKDQYPKFLEMTRTIDRAESQELTLEKEEEK